MNKAVFEGVVFYADNQTVGVVSVGDEPAYVVVEDGFRYHVDAHRVDEQVMARFAGQVQENRDLIGEGMMKMLGKDDLFTKVSVDRALKNFSQQAAKIYETGIPQETRAYLGMLGFRIVIDRHGDVQRIDMPTQASEEDE
jgi:hypothetical protein